MKKNYLTVAFIVICYAFIMCIPDANAVGLGVYGNISQGSMSGTAEANNNETDYDSDISGFGIGFVLDTCVARNSLFNYRLQIGYEGLNHSSENEYGLKSEHDFTGFALTQDFGFGVYRAGFMRLWLGPELRIAYGMGENKKNSDWSAYYLDFGIGPVVGANFHLGSSPVSLAVKVSYLFEAYIGANIYDGSNSNIDDQVLSGSGSSIYLTFSVLFRLGDYY